MDWTFWFLSFIAVAAIGVILFIIMDAISYGIEMVYDDDMGDWGDE